MIPALAPGDGTRGGEEKRWGSRGRLVLVTLGGLVLAQALAYWFKLPLSLGPRVILEPWLLEQGWLIYDNVGDIHTPLLPLLLQALRRLSPDGMLLAKVAVISALSLTAAATFLLGRRASGCWGGLGAAAFFVIWSPHFDFGKLWYESLLAPLYALLLVILLPREPAPSRARLGLAGILAGLAILTKQHAVVVAILLVAWAGWRAWRKGGCLRGSLANMILLCGGAALPLLAFGTWYWERGGSLGDVGYWLVTHSLVGGYRTLAAQLPSARQVGIVVASAVALPVAVWRIVRPNAPADPGRERLLLGVLMLAGGSATAYPRFEMFHLQPVLPVLAWLVASMATELRRRWLSPGFSRWALTLAFTYAAVVAGSGYAPVLRGGGVPPVHQYSDLVPVAQAVARHLGPGQTMYIFPDDERSANLYYLLRRKPPGFWVFTYPWHMTNRVRARILESLARRRPEWILAPPDSWGTAACTPAITAFVSEQYRPVDGLAWEHGEIVLLARKR